MPDSGKTREQLLAELTSALGRIAELEGQAGPGLAATTGRKAQAPLPAQLYQELLDHVSAYIYLKDRQHRYVYANRATLELFGCTGEELLGRDDTWFFPPDTVERLREVDLRVFSGEHTEEEIDVPHAPGGRRVYLERKMPLYEQAAPEEIWGLCGISQDITGRKLGEEALRRSEEKFRTVADYTYDWEAWRDLDGTYVWISPACERITGYTAAELLADPGLLERLVHPEDAGFFLQHHHDRVGLATDRCYSFDFRIINRAGQVVWLNHNCMSIAGQDGVPLGRRSNNRDITKRKRVEEALEQTRRKLEALSVTDGLTGISNRRRFDQVLAQEHARHARSGAELSLALLDIDHFKAFNDLYGHVSGDKCLRQVAQVIADCATRPADLAARYGGEEFACILPETDHAGAVAIAERIRRGIQALAIPHKGADAAGHVTASLGVVTVLCTADRPVEDIVSQVDALLYEAKSRGRNQVRFVPPAR